MTDLPLGEKLVKDGIITRENLDAALAQQKIEKTKRIGTILVDMGFLTEEELLSELSARMNTPLVNLKNYAVDINAVNKIPKKLALQYNLIAIGLENDSLILAVHDPLDLYALEDIKLITNMPLSLRLADTESINKTIEYYYAEIETKKALKAASTATAQSIIDYAEEIENTANNAPVVSLLNSMLLKGQSSNASDIHIEPFENKTVVRMRIDGQLVEYLQLTSGIHGPLIARIKILANLDIAEKRKPQDGHFKVKVEGSDLNIRISIIPTIYGEKAVLRFLGLNSTLDNPDKMGMNEENHAKFSRLLQNPYGIIFLTGPTGSGKTTTLYMALERLTNQPINITTIEDPVEKNIAKTNQTQVNEAAGFTFATGLRSLLRQDPDIIMVGETRDNETAKIAVGAAITGHLVLSTLHTNDAVSAIVRLNDMGVEPYMIANSMVGVVAQRLVKKICPYCKKAHTSTDSETQILGKTATVYKGEGCQACNYTGYKGRTAVHEILEVDSTIRTIIANKEPIGSIYQYLESTRKLKNLKESITEMVLAGITTVDELLRHTYYIE